MSSQEPIGIMLLEKQLLSVSADSAVNPRPAKKSRGGNTLLPSDTEAWVEMARYV